MPETFDSLYRVVGFGDQARRMALYDIHRDDSVWVNTVGYDEDGPIYDELTQVESGNLVEAQVTDAGDENEYWNLLEFEIVYDSVLYYVITDGYAPGPVEQIWDQRDTSANYVSAGHENEKGNYEYEIQLCEKTLEVDGVQHNVFDDLQRGELLAEPFFNGESCEYIEEANAVIVVKPESEPYIVTYLFNERNDEFNDVWGALYDYVE